MTETIISYGKHKPIRSVLKAGAVWLAATDVFAALNRDFSAALIAGFSNDHVSVHHFQESSDQATQTLSIVGAQTVSASPWGLPQRIFYRWLAKQDILLRSTDDDVAAPLRLTMLANGTLPPQPAPGGPEWQAWLNLQEQHRRSKDTWGQTVRAARARMAVADMAYARPSQSTTDRPLGLKPRPTPDASATPPISPAQRSGHNGTT